MLPFLNKTFVTYESHSQNCLLLSNYLNGTELLCKCILFLVCPLGFYGETCNDPCGNCRDGNQCHHITGTCVSGCDAGYKEDLCKAREYKCNQVLMYM